MAGALRAYLGVASVDFVPAACSSYISKNSSVPFCLIRRKSGWQGCLTVRPIRQVVALFLPATSRRLRRACRAVPHLACLPHRLSSSCAAGWQGCVLLACTAVALSFPHALPGCAPVAGQGCRQSAVRPAATRPGRDEAGRRARYISSAPILGRGHVSGIRRKEPPVAGRTPVWGPGSRRPLATTSGGRRSLKGCAWPLSLGLAVCLTAYIGGGRTARARAARRRKLAVCLTAYIDGSPATQRRGSCSRTECERELHSLRIRMLGKAARGGRRATCRSGPCAVRRGAAADRGRPGRL